MCAERQWLQFNNLGMFQKIILILKIILLYVKQNEISRINILKGFSQII